MKIRVVAVGTSMPGWVAAGWKEYTRRMPRQLDVELAEVRVSRGGDSSAGRSEEGRALLARCPDSGPKVALHERGKAWSTRDLAGRLERWMMDGDPVSLLVGGAGGHSEEALAACTARWSLGPLTYPHMLVRVILAEQLYRAWTLICGHPYHRE